MGRVNCWRHRWGQWDRGEAYLTACGKRTGDKRPFQWRECGRCGKRQVERLCV